MSDYQEAIQNPASCFSDATLKTGAPALNALGLPQPVTGGFCSVYKVTSGKTSWAVRCFRAARLSAPGESPVAPHLRQ